MTTADIMFAQPGDPESLRDHEYETRTVLFAILAAILIHLLVAFFLAALAAFSRRRLPLRTSRLNSRSWIWRQQLRKIPRSSRRTNQKKRPNPKRKHLNRTPNSIGASELAAAGQLPLPSQTGKDQPFMDLETQQHSLDLKGAQAQPSAAPQERPSPSTAPQTQPAPVTAAEQFAMLTQKPPQPRDSCELQHRNRSRRIGGRSSEHTSPETSPIAVFLPLTPWAHRLAATKKL